MLPTLVIKFSKLTFRPHLILDYTRHGGKYSVIARVAQFLNTSMACKKTQGHERKPRGTGTYVRAHTCTLFLGHSRRKLPPTVSSLEVLQRVNKLAASWIPNCVCPARYCARSNAQARVWGTCYMCQPAEAESRLINNGDDSITMRKRGDGALASGQCYPQTNHVRAWMNTWVAQTCTRVCTHQTKENEFQT